MRRSILFAAAFLVFSFSPAKNWEKTGSGVIINLSDESGRSSCKMKVEVISDQIITFRNPAAGTISIQEIFPKVDRGSKQMHLTKGFHYS